MLFNFGETGFVIFSLRDFQKREDVQNGMKVDRSRTCWYLLGKLTVHGYADIVLLDNAFENGFIMFSRMNFGYSSDDH